MSSKRTQHTQQQQSKPINFKKKKKKLVNKPDYNIPLNRWRQFKDLLLHHSKVKMKKLNGCSKIQACWRGYNLRKRIWENKKIKQWLIDRKKRKNKGNIDILNKEILLSRYNSFVNEVRKQLLIEIKYGSYIGRIPNFPECISENIVLYVLRHLDVKCTWKCKGDILVGETNISGEVKCHFNGPSQFSPSKKKDGDILYYLEAETHIYQGYFKLYKIENYNTELKKVKINKDSLLEDQQDSGRRPRFIIKNIWPNLEDKLIWKGTINELLR